MSSGPITLIEPKPMRSSALERGVAPLLVPDSEEQATRKAAAARARKADDRSGMPGASVAWARQPVSFAELKGYHNPFHSRCLRIKARMTVGLGFEEEPEGGALKLPVSAQGSPMQQQLVLAAMDNEATGNGYLEVITAAGGKIASATWLQGETMEVSEDRLWFRQTVNTPGRAQRRVTFFPAWPTGEGKPLPMTRYCLHIQQDGTWSTFYGEPDWLGALQSVMLFDSAMKFNRAAFDNNCIPSWLILLLGAKLSDEPKEDPNNAGHYLPSQRDEFVAWMKNTYGGASNYGKAMLLDGFEVESDKASVQFQKLQDGPKDGDFLKLLDTCRDHILSCHGVPPRLAGVVASGSLGGSGELYGQLLAFQQDIRPKQVMWQQALSRLIPYLGDGAPKSLTLRQMDIEPFRSTSPALPTLPPDSSAAKIAAEVDQLLKQAGVR